MRTTAQTTFILLDRGDEDVRLLKELRSVIVALGIRDTREWVTRFPLLNELQQGLVNETISEED